MKLINFYVNEDLFPAVNNKINDLKLNRGIAYVSALISGLVISKAGMQYLNEFYYGGNPEIWKTVLRIGGSTALAWLSYHLLVDSDRREDVLLTIKSNSNMNYSDMKPNSGNLTVSTEKQLDEIVKIHTRQKQLEDRRIKRNFHRF